MKKILNKKQKIGKIPDKISHILMAIAACLILVAIIAEWDTSFFKTEFYEGDIVLRAIYAPFDFKIKGEMSDPKFYLGPISKQALTSMAVDKVSEIVQEMTKPKSQGEGAAAPKSDIEKAKEYIELFKGLIKK